METKKSLLLEFTLNSSHRFSFFLFYSFLIYFLLFFPDYSFSVYLVNPSEATPAFLNQSFIFYHSWTILREISCFFLPLFFFSLGTSWSDRRKLLSPCVNHIFIFTFISLLFLPILFISWDLCSFFFSLFTYLVIRSEATPAFVCQSCLHISSLLSYYEIYFELKKF